MQEDVIIYYSQQAYKPHHASKQYLYPVLEIHFSVIFQKGIKTYQYTISKQNISMTPNQVTD